MASLWYIDDCRLPCHTARNLLDTRDSDGVGQRRRWISIDCVEGGNEGGKVIGRDVFVVLSYPVQQSVRSSKYMYS